MTLNGTNGSASQRGVTVFCGSSNGNDPAYERAANQLGASLAKQDRLLVYGGGTKGLMGAVARAALDAGGQVHGVMPTAFLAHETSRDKSPYEGHPRNKHTHVRSMHERKQIMAKLSEAFVALPGGYGTCEEFFESVTWVQLGIQKKPVILLNVNGFYDALRTFVNNAIAAGFIPEANRAFLIFVDEREGDMSFDWGAAALEAIQNWHDKGMGGGQAFDLKWPEQERLELS
ncbi:hypothetical protein ACM66B_000956 [Microbotryomycetes sp. NB124-2]